MNTFNPSSFEPLKPNDIEDFITSRKWPSLTASLEPIAREVGMTNATQSSVGTSSVDGAAISQMSAPSSESAIDILEQVEHIIQEGGDSRDYACDASVIIEPTPIASEGLKVVRSLPFLESTQLTLFQQEHLIGDVINVLLKKRSRDSTLKSEKRVGGFRTSSLQSPLKKQRRTFPNSNASASYPAGTHDQDASSSTESSEGSAAKNSNAHSQQRFRAYQAEQWYERFQDMIAFQKHYGHCCVPNTFPINPNLATWVKRQRYQFKLKQQGKHSTLTDERQVALEHLGFVWDSHGAAWLERFNELVLYRDQHGDSNVPTNYPPNRQLSIWVKCQRRQYKLYTTGGHSNMTKERIEKLESLDFVWNPRGLRENMK